MKPFKENLRQFLQHHLCLILPIAMLAWTPWGCTDDFGEQKPSSKYGAEDGVFLVNEGQFMSGNGSVSYYNPLKKEVSAGIFYGANGRPAGDIPQFLAFREQTGYLVVNNSNTIEVVGLEDFKVKTTITGLNLPRQVLISGNTGYVSQTGSSKIAVISLTDNKIKGEIEGFKSGDRMVISGSKLFVANWTSYYIPKPNNTVMVFDTGTRQLIDSVVVAMEPNSMVTDASGRIWVLSSGGYLQEEYPALTCIDPATLQIISTLQFPDKSRYPSMLSVSPDGTKLYYVDVDVYRLNVNDGAIPNSPFIQQPTGTIYGFAVDPDTGDLYVADAKDFQQKGEVSRYNAAGSLTDQFQVGINPSGIFFYRK